MAPENIIDVKGLAKSFGSIIAVNSIDLAVKRGEIFGFLGPNGSGKTTTLRMLCGLLTPDEGQGSCLGYNVRTQSYEIKQHVGYMAQRFSLYEDLTIYENVRFRATLYNLANSKQQIEKCIDQLGLTHKQHQLAGTLSGGWKQRLALATALLHSPQLLLLDEPTAGVDPTARRDFWDQIHELSHHGVTSLVSTHYMDEAERCHYLAYISQGNVLVAGNIEEIIAHTNLTTWSVNGKNLGALATKLRSLSGIDQVSAFGDELHVSGKDADRLKHAITPFLSDTTYQWQSIKPSLEDAFISLGAQERISL